MKEFEVAIIKILSFKLMPKKKKKPEKRAKKKAKKPTLNFDLCYP